MVPTGFSMVSKLRSFHNVGQVAKQVLSPLSSGSKDHGTHKEQIMNTSWKNRPCFQENVELVGAEDISPMKQDEKCNNLPHKLGDVLVFDGGEGFSFYPFSKVVGGNQQQLFRSGPTKSIPH